MITKISDFRTTTAGIGGCGRPGRDPPDRPRLSGRWSDGSVRLNHGKPRGLDPEAVHLSGRPAEREGTPTITGIGTGSAGTELDEIGVDPPAEDGVISGPTGALINRAAQLDYDSLGLIVECNPNFPDPEAASALLENAVAPIADLSIDVRQLLEQDEEIREHREQFAQRMQEIGQDESTQARPLRMYQ